MRNKKVGIGNGKRGFYFLLLTSYFLLLTLFLPEDAMAQFGQRDTYRMKKYSLWGDITLQYDDENTKSGGATDHRNMFTQNYTLNFRSYIISPKIMIYTINTGFGIRAGTLYEKGTSKSYGIETVFFRDMPFNFSLHASKNDGYDYKNTSYGLSMTYTRKVRRVPTVTPAAPTEENINKNLNINANLNKNANLNANTDEEGNINTNANIAPKPRPKLDMRRPSSNLFYDVINILPISTVLNIDRNTSQLGSSKSDWMSADLRFSGFLPKKTLYNLNLDYHKWTSGGTSTKGVGAELNTTTLLEWSFFQEFRNYIYYRKNDITSYNINSWLTGIKGKRRYEIYANYSSTSNGESAKQYSILADVQNVVPYTYKKVDLFYDAGIGFQRLENKNDFFAKGRLSANKRLSLNTNLNSSLGLRGGTEYSEADFLTGISYTFRPRKGYSLRVELDPQRDIIKTQTFKPQVSGWDYVIRTGYTFGISKTIGGSSATAASTTSGTRKTSMSHRADLNLNIYLRGVTIASDAYLYYVTSSGKTFQWNNSLYATVMRKVGVTIGTGMTVDMPESGIKTTNYNIYNLITYNYSRNVLLRLDSRYTKTMPADTTTLEIIPSIAWRWRSVFVDLEVRLKTDKTSNGAETKERRIMLRVTRPFKIL